MYQPRHKRQFGYYVMPVLSGERLIGRVAPRLDRRRGVLAVEGLFAEDGFGADMLAGGAAPPGGPVATPIESLASFVGASSVCYPGSSAAGVS